LSFPKDTNHILLETPLDYTKNVVFLKSKGYLIRKCFLFRFVNWRKRTYL